MAVLDFELLTYRAVKALILADPWLTVAGSVTTDGVTGYATGKANAANGLRAFVWYDSPPDPNPSRKPNKQPGDLCELTLDVISSSDDGRTATPTMANRFDASAPYVGTAAVELEAVVVNTTPTLQPTSAIAAHLMTALRSVATLSVDGFTARLQRPSSRSEVTTQGPASGTLRRVVRVRIPVAIAYRGP